VRGVDDDLRLAGAAAAVLALLAVAAVFRGITRRLAEYR
jgi:hypothetical protein